KAVPLLLPLTGVLVPLGFLTLGSALLWAPLARALAWPLVWLTSLLTHLAAWFAAIPHGSYRIPAPPPWAMLAFFASFAALAITRWKPARIAAAAVLLASAAIIAIYPFAPALHPSNLEITALDVGQGDALVVVSPLGRTMLIDGGGSFAGGPMAEAARAGGPEPGEDAVSPYLWSRGIQRLDIVALTHAHQDHIGGLRAILDNFQVGRLWIGREITARAQVALEEQARRRKIPIEHERSGDAADWGGARMEVLWPEAASAAPATEAQNNDSLVLRLSYGRRAFLLPGDIERQAEAALLAQAKEANLAADVLKAGHHGSRNSTTEEFLARVHPQLALISAGAENPYGHPSAEMLARLEAARVRVLRTDRNGAIQVLTNGENLEVSCFAGCAGAGNR
ncbi:MAG: DNA internalization-related competence protein ComEC/Rec2, partial [Acidobacteriia bacterium]|nr:DNA internalization-related competence protein ComEC/Rec2 [Terriglobia bacterium]